MKKAYQTPALTAEEFDLADVIAASAPDEPVEEESTLEERSSQWEGPAEI